MTSPDGIAIEPKIFKQTPFLEISTVVASKE
jgi:hypothetical protein